MADQPNGNPISPITPATPGAPRPITVRLKPVIHKPVAAPQAPAPSPLSPVTPAAAPAAAAAPAQAAAPAAPVAPIRPMGRITKSGTQTIVMQPIATAKAFTPTSSQAQAAKSKTSRITLDSAIGVSPTLPVSGPKTIRLKRPTDLAAHRPTIEVPAAADSEAPTVKMTPVSATGKVHHTSRIPDEVVSAAEAAAPAAHVKTLKIRRSPAPAAAAPAAETPAEAAAAPAAEGLTPIAELETVQAPETKGAKAFTMVAVICAAASVVVGLLLVWCLMASGMGPAAGKNNPASISGPALPWVAQ